MVWQDLVLAGGGLVLTVGLVPMLRSPEHPPLRTSVTLLVVLSSYVVTLASLELWVAAVGTALQAVIWGAVALQRLKFTRRGRRSNRTTVIRPRGDLPPTSQDGEQPNIGSIRGRDGI